jgi:hypothetical protein
MSVKKIRKKQTESLNENSNKNLVGLGGIIMLILTNYQEEIKHAISILLGNVK